MKNTKLEEEMMKDDLKDPVVQEMFLDAVRCERLRQNKKFPDLKKQQSLTVDRLYSILGEEVGEVAKANLEHDDFGCCTELIEVAAVCCKIIELKFPRLMDKVHDHVLHRALNQQSKQ